MLREALAEKAFRRFWFCQLQTMSAYQMLTVAIGWQMYDLTGSALSLGFVGLAQFIPQLALTLVVGQVADRFDRRRITQACQILECAMTAVLAAGSLLHFTDERMLYVGAFVLGSARAFEMPTMQALLPGLVEPARLPSMLALSASARQTAAILGPALGGVLYLAGAGTVYALCAVLFAMAAAAIGGIPKPMARQRREPVSIDSVLGGIRYVRNKPELLGAISLDLFSVLLGGATALLPIFARDILGAGPWGLGILRGAPGIGALAMSVYLAHSPLGGRVGRKMFAAVAVFGVATIVFGMSRSFPLSLLALVVLGASDMVSVVIRSSLVQLETPDEMRGRVSAVSAVFIGTSNQLGEFESGVTAAWFGAAPSVVIGGMATLVVVAVWMRLFPSLARRDRLGTGES